MSAENWAPKYSLATNDNAGLEAVPPPQLEASPHSWSHPSGWQQQPLTEQYYPGGSTEATEGLNRAGDPNQRILGLSVRTFWIIIVALVVVVAGAIGGGLGGGLAARSSSTSTQSDRSSTSTTPSPFSSSATDRAGTTTSTTSNTPTLTTPVSGAVSPAPTDGGCPTINGTAYTPINAEGRAIPLQGDGQAQSFVRLCNTNYPAEGANGNPQVYDIMKVFMPSLEDCIAACASYNVNYQKNRASGLVAVGGLCRAVSIVKLPGEYCYLKNNTGVNNTFKFPTSYSSATLNIDNLQGV